MLDEILFFSCSIPLCHIYLFYVHPGIIYISNPSPFCFQPANLVLWQIVVVALYPELSCRSIDWVSSFRQASVGEGDIAFSPKLLRFDKSTQEYSAIP